jgi:hypothetical protein
VSLTCLTFPCLSSGVPSVSHCLSCNAAMYQRCQQSLSQSAIASPPHRLSQSQSSFSRASPTTSPISQWSPRKMKSTLAERDKKFSVTLFPTISFCAERGCFSQLTCDHLPTVLNLCYVCLSPATLIPYHIDLLAYHLLAVRWPRCITTPPHHPTAATPGLPSPYRLTFLSPQLPQATNNLLALRPQNPDNLLA